MSTRYTVTLHVPADGAFQSARSYPVSCGLRQAHRIAGEMLENPDRYLRGRSRVIVINDVHEGTLLKKFEVPD